MSRFLAPIHQIMYNKIMLQEQLTDRILEYADRIGQSEVRAAVAGKYGEADRRPLEESIDLQNIHGWLESRIGGAERRYACAVTLLLAGHPERLGQLQEQVRVFGAEHPAEEGISAGQALDYFNLNLLNGMPCDRVIEVCGSDAQKVVYRELIDKHSDFWTEAGGDGENYYILRTALVSGMLGSAFEYVKNDNDEYEIRKAAA